MTHTYAILELSQAAFDEIKKKLADAGYQHQFHDNDGQPVIDMHGLAVASETQRPPARDPLLGNRHD